MQTVTDPNQMTIGQRIDAPTPKFFRQVRKWSLIVAAVGAALISGGAAVPALITVGTILATAGAVGTAVSSVTVDQVALEQQAGLVP
jgi:hypothetical protein